MRSVICLGGKLGSVAERQGIRLVLASASASRLRVLRDAGFAPEVIASGVDEDIDTTDIATAVVALAERKGAVVSHRCSNALVIACDSMLDFHGQALGKPASVADAVGYWRRLAGHEAVLCTGHWVKDTRSGLAASDLARTTVRFGTPSDAEIEAYVATGEPLNLAGAFSIEGYGAPFIEGIDGDPSNVLGLSLPLLRALLARLDIAITDLWSIREVPVPSSQATASDRASSRDD
jgi:septum formation protein